MTTCVNLRERFGNQYRITFDEAYDPRNRPRDKLDPWMMQIPCRFGTIYPHGGRVLAIEVDQHPMAVRLLEAIPACRGHQASNRERTFLFDLADFPAVAAVVRPRQKRRLSDAQRQSARERIMAWHAQKPSPERFQASATHANGPT
jgi:hypothetical protein